MADDIDTPGAWRQATAALLLVPVLGLGLWLLGRTASSDRAPSPAKCSGGEHGKAPGHAPRRVSGAQLCAALNRADLPELLGTPGEKPNSASGSGGSLRLADGREIATPSARVEFESFTVTLSATYDRFPVTGAVTLLGSGARQRTVLGRPGVLYTDRTIRIRFRLDGGDSDSGPGVPVRTLAVALDAKDSGGSLEVSLWRSDGVLPDDAVLLRVAEKVLPTVPGWAS
ncbi:DUF6215 domain-containing protein, partial [Streptomyces sp. AF1A]|uniref:DUF6215 domain-containing protein n=1 Tax=Streptomyces sp. AF1A TaxID=3394350 RepID=UPI0039BC3244